MADASSHSIIAESCLKYLYQFEQPGLTLTNVQDQYALAKYTAESWSTHMRHADGELERLSNLAIPLFSNDNAAYNIWVLLCDRQKWIECPLYHAALLGLTVVTKLLLEAGADANKQKGYHGKALQAAASRGHDEVVRELLNASANVDERGRHSGDALYAASAEGHLHVVKLLIDAKADINAISGFCGSALQAAAYKGHAGVVELLIDAGADLSVSGYFGDALFAAIHGGHAQVVELLLKRGADPTARVLDDCSALFYAVQRGQLGIFKTMLDGELKIEGSDGQSQTILDFAFGRSDFGTIELLLCKGIGLRAVAEDKEAMLRSAAYNGRVRMAEIVLGLGAAPTPDIRNGWSSPLNLASEEGHVEVVELLLAHRADPNTAESNGVTPLLSAAFGGHLAVFQILLSHKAEINSKDSTGMTPLYGASLKCFADVVKLLLECGADQSITNKDGWSPLDIAAANRRGGRRRIVDLSRLGEQECPRP
ncbi:hypothetical protein E8E12_004917 [Didymella heteroderae]|uniref:Uncharacterized protein n=1 Tax=Didymella heteroderae TaxID=1769908 RepID=A0A9P4WRU2_9PLEO|nr:hypothetical protein E8E12_004917 [Didymella heteroderae]